MKHTLDKDEEQVLAILAADIQNLVDEIIIKKPQAYDYDLQQCAARMKEARQQLEIILSDSCAKICPNDEFTSNDIGTVEQIDAPSP